MPHLNKVLQSLNPLLPVPIESSRPEPDERGLHVFLLWSWPEPHTRISSYHALVSLPSRLSVINSLEEYKQHRCEKSHQEGVVENIEHDNLG